MIPIIIPTLGRDRIITLELFTPKMLKATTIVTSSSRQPHLQKLYPKVLVVSCPHQHNAGTPRDPKKHGIAHVFQWIAELHNYPIVIAEDDLYFYVRRTKKWSDSRTRPAQPEEVEDAIRRMAKLTGKYAMVGMSAKFGNNHLKKPLVEATRMHGIWTLDCRLLRLSKFFRFNPPERPDFFMSDFYMNLQFLTSGRPTALIGDTMHNQPGSNAPGGCASYRNAENQRLSAEFLAKKFPSVVNVVLKTATSWGPMAIRYDVSVQWKKALRLGQAQQMELL